MSTADETAAGNGSAGDGLALPRAAAPTTATGPLAGVRVVAVEHSVAGPLSTRILGDLGADVLKVERPATGGDFARHWDHNAGGEGAQFWWLNRRKRSIALTLDEEGRALLGELLADADVLVHNMSPAAAARVGFDAETLAAAYPRLIACQISGYGADSDSAPDRKAYDMLIQAEAGIMSLTGTPDEVCRVGVSMCDVATGLYAAVLVLAALRRREQDGAGAQLDLTMFDVALEFVGPMLISNLNSGVEYRRSSARHHAIAPYGVFECRDGAQIVIAIEQDGEWRELATELLGDPALADDPRFATNAQRIAHRGLVDALVEARLGAMDVEDVVAACERHRFAYGRVNDVSAVAHHPVLAERGAVEQVQSAAGAAVRSMVGLAERAFDTSTTGRVRPPQLDEDRGAVMQRLERAT
ncbi:CaiB/BaiF CoA-transferase family protein [Conexibacter sp. CPCC 206217]|uniref:CaiB/BaiF CoA transferase family protein n=1 Tax=Conexibacter sp. CPCC 206217 TaxID=3064574 RepID=UPI0027187B2F|nr:CoA transferase [Conexibacter sp. CPCC 206217]MDO8211646.1 CoA transferase [Conexibacter sp. CPCC 206217]